MVNSIDIIITADEDPVTVFTVAELDQLLDRIASGASLDEPPLVALEIPARQRSLMIGFRGQVGVANYMDFAERGAFVSRGTTSGVKPPAYFYCDQWTAITEDAEIPIEVVRAGAREFLTTSERPTGIDWQRP